jgi:HAD superfamily hydrolase (TIGR01549 family)
LRASSPNWGTFFTQQAALLDVPSSAENQLHAERWMYSYFASDQPAVDLDRFEYDETAWRHNLHQQYLLALGCPPEKADAIAPSMWKVMQEDYQPKRILLPGVTETLQTLIEKQFIVGIVTNRNHPVKDYLIECGLSPLIDFSLAAGEIGIWKPDKGIFDHALMLAGTKAAETLFIGDNYYADIIGAQNAGLFPILFDYRDLFPEADCLRIESISELLSILGDGPAGLSNIHQEHS